MFGATIAFAWVCGAATAAATSGSLVLPRAELIPERPSISVGPIPPYRPLPTSPARNRTCVVSAKGNGTDDGPAILEAFKSCNNGGAVVLSEDTTYTIGTALDLTFLEHVDWGKLILCVSRLLVPCMDGFSSLRSLPSSNTCA